MHPDIVYFSMFSGIGGFDLALRNLGAKCIGHAEIDPKAIAVYNHQFGEQVNNYGDVSNIDSNCLEQFDLLVGGFPCQTFSHAGKREGFNDIRGTLFYEVARLLEAQQPRHILLENVKGLASHEKGQTLARMLTILGELGYQYQCGVLNSRYYGVPQGRERIFIAGYLGSYGRPQVFPIPQSNCQHAPEEEDKRREKERIQRQNICSTLDANYWKGPGSGRQLIKTKEGHLRRLTPLECERVMGFPDGWTKINGLADTHRYRLLGNAVVPNVAQEVLERMFV